MGTSSGTRHFPAWLLLAAVVILLLPTISAAQEPVKSFDQLNTRLKVGDTVWVTDAQGREVRGKIRDLGASSLDLAVNGGRPMTASEISQVRVKRRDSLVNGVAIGAMCGVVGGLFLSAGGDESLMEPQYGVTLGVAVGAGIGLAVDALRSG